jgi:hypothetical protein
MKKCMKKKLCEFCGRVITNGICSPLCENNRHNELFKLLSMGLAIPDHLRK